MERQELEHIISLTFDSDPKVRLKAAQKLANVDDPAATLALIELVHDKDNSVSAAAKKILDERKKKAPEILPLTELFKGVNFSGGEEKKELGRHAEKVLEPLQKLFERRLDKKSMEEITPKIMEAYREKGSAAVQEIITTYLQAVKDSNRKTYGKHTEHTAEHSKQSHEEALSDVEDVSVEKMDISIDLDMIGSEVDIVEREEYFTLTPPKRSDDGSHTQFVSVEMPSVFKIAYDTMLASEGDEKIMKNLSSKLKQFFSKQIDLAFSTAKHKFKRRNITDISDIRDGMKSIYTEPLVVVKVDELSYPRTKRKMDIFRRIVVRDAQGKEGIIYLFNGRGKGIAPGMRIRVERGKAKTFKFSGETAITVDKRGKIVAEF